MKQYLDQQQTAKLIELGFEKPKSVIGYSYPEQSDKQKAYEESLGLEPYLATVDQIEFEYAYSIGELIEMLPEYASQRLRYVATKRAWIFDVDILGKQGRCHRGAYYKELIDALYEMIIMLKEKEVI